MKLLIILLSLTLISCEEAKEDIEASLKSPSPESIEPNEKIINSETYSVISDESESFTRFYFYANDHESVDNVYGETLNITRSSISLSLKEDQKFSIAKYGIHYTGENWYLIQNSGDYKAELINHKGSEKILFTLTIKEANIREFARVNPYASEPETIYNTHVIAREYRKTHIGNSNVLKFVYNKESSTLEKFEDDIPGSLLNIKYQTCSNYNNDTMCVFDNS